MVRLPDGTHARRARVRATSQSGYAHEVFTNDQGRYEIRELPRGRFSLSAVNLEDPDQVSESAETDTMRVFSNLITVNLFLRNRPDRTQEVPRSLVLSARDAAERVPKEAQKAFENGLKLGEENRLAQAEGSYGKAIAIYPSYRQALIERGNLRLAAGRLDDASTDFARVLKLDPHSGPALRGSGVCKFQLGRFPEAVSDLEKAAAAEPDVAKTQMFLGLALMAQDDRERAAASLQRALSLDPKGSARAHVHLASILFKQNRPAEAAAQLDAYLEAVPNAPDRDRLLALRKSIK